MESYGQYCPVAHAAQIFAERWTPLIVRELLVGIEHFNELERGLPGIPRALLMQRLRRLEDMGVVERHRDDRGRTQAYRLTPAGRELQAVVDVLGAWGVRWAFGDPRPDELDPGLLVWWMKRRVMLDQLLPRRVTVEFEFRGARTGRYWLLLQPSEVSVCLEHPGFDVDVRVTADIAGFYRVWLGRVSLDQAMRAGAIRLDGSVPLVRAFPAWFAWSPMADLVRAHVTSSHG